MTTELKESSGIKFSLSFLIQIITAIVLGVWGYSQLDSRISFLETITSSNSQHIESIQTEQANSQDQPISSDHIQNTSLRFLEREMAKHEAEIIRLRDLIYDMK
tara:strand:- start:1685 stop:1996 length:312 start_codon:yes stop_codon:yes gene_type:complete